MDKPIILWFRRDLRLSDHAALCTAVSSGAPIIPLFILDDVTPKHRKMGGASRWWLHHSLKSLDASLQKLGSKLILREGESVSVLQDIARETGADEVYAMHHYEPWWRNAEKAVREKMTLHLYHGNYLLPPGVLKTGSGDPYKIYTPFWKSLRDHMPPDAPLDKPHAIMTSNKLPQSDILDDWGLLPTKPDWAGGMRAKWSPGEAGAAALSDDFTDRSDQYDEQRNIPSIKGTSELSAHLHFGEVSPAMLWHKHQQAGGSVEVFLKEIVWRDYATNVITQYPKYGSDNARDRFDVMAWRDMDDDDVKSDYIAWTKGRTGYPIVDAGMRELWATGIMHNRVRMLAASFLIKHLLIHWTYGEQWFWDTLVDADYASNAVNWQWVAGTGIDSNMFVRIMAPLSQSEKFDAGDYIRKWVPELADLDDPFVHDPEEYGMTPKKYTRKIIGHKQARARALEAYNYIKS